MSTIFAVIAAGLVIFLLLTTKPLRKTGMCPRGGPRWKNAVGYLLIKMGKKRTETDDISDPEQINSRVPVPEGTAPDQYNDSFVFQGSDENGNLVMTRIGFRGGGEKAEVWLWMALNGTKYHNIEQAVEHNPKNQTDIDAGGLRFSCNDKKQSIWTVEYDGKLEPGQVDCNLSLTFSPRSALYHSDKHMNISTYARAMAEMEWSREFFTNLKSENQTRIEQGGTFDGTVTIGGTTEKVSMLGVRDHSWGKRDWTFIKRYIWNVLSFTEPLELGGKKYSYLVYTTVNYGTSFRCLVSGWIGGEDSVLPIVAATDQELIGEAGVIPEEFTCRFQPQGHKPREVTVYRYGPEQSWFMRNGDFEVCEAYCTFVVSAGGGIKRGVGMSEFGYSQSAGYSARFS